MGLQDQLSDMSSDSTIIFAVVIIAKSARYLNSVVSTMMHAIGLLSPPSDSHQIHDDDVGSRLAGLILLYDQLDERDFPNQDQLQPGTTDSDCVVCMSRLGEGHDVRKLACGHLFHKDCLHGWLHLLHFSCPICRAPLVQDHRVECTRRRVAKDLLEWFPFQ